MSRVIDMDDVVVPKVIAARTSRDVQFIRLGCGHIRTTKDASKKSFYCTRCDNHFEAIPIRSGKAYV